MITKGIISDLVFYYLEYRKLSNSLSQFDRFYILILCCALLNNFDGTDSEHYKTQFVTEIRDHKVYDDISSALQNTKSIMPNEIIFIIDLINELFTIDHSNGPVEFYELSQWDELVKLLDTANSNVYSKITSFLQSHYKVETESDDQVE